MTPHGVTNSGAEKTPPKFCHDLFSSLHFLNLLSPGLFGLLFKNHGRVSLPRNTTLYQKEGHRIIKHCVVMERRCDLRRSMVLCVFLKAPGVAEGRALGTAAVPWATQPLLGTAAAVCVRKGRKGTGTAAGKRGEGGFSKNRAHSHRGAAGPVTATVGKFLLQLWGSTGVRWHGQWRACRLHLS